MTELDLYKFIQNNDVEIDWRGEELMVWLHSSDLEDFADIVNVEEGPGIDCTLINGGHIVIDIVAICDNKGINPENILPKEELF